MEGQETFMPEEERIPEVVHHRGWKGGQNLPTIDNLAGSGENTRMIEFALWTKSLPKIDYTDTEALEERINLYFGYCAEQDMRPTVSGLSSAIGVSRITIWNWRSGNRRPANFEVIDRAYNMLEELWESYMINSKIHPANGIFLGKNQFGYKDVQDVTITPNNGLGETIPIEVIEEKYASLPEE